MLSVTKRKFAGLMASGLIAVAALSSFAGIAAAADKVTVGALRFTSHSASFVAFERDYFNPHFPDELVNRCPEMEIML